MPVVNSAYLSPLPDEHTVAPLPSVDVGRRFHSERWRTGLPDVVGEIAIFHQLRENGSRVGTSLGSSLRLHEGDNHCQRR